jgi:hypothetical protein
VPVGKSYKDVKKEDSENEEAEKYKKEEVSIRSRRPHLGV